jgi:hypothetical protein
MSEFLEYKLTLVEKAKSDLSECATLDELKKVFMSLGSLMADPELITLKDKLKLTLK